MEIASYIAQILDYIPELSIVVVHREKGSLLYANKRGLTTYLSCNGKAGRDWKEWCRRRIPHCRIRTVEWPEGIPAALVTWQDAFSCPLQREKGIFIRTFGHFDVFVDGKPVIFRSAKAKELLALLIDRQGGTVNSDQIIAALWENRPNNEATQNLCSKVVKALYNELKQMGIEEILVTARGTRYLDTTKFRCDMYELLAGSHTADHPFYGEYLSDYSWAEERIAMLIPYISRTSVEQK